MPHKSAQTIFVPLSREWLDSDQDDPKLRLSGDAASLTHLVVLLLLLVMHWALPGHWFVRVTPKAMKWSLSFSLSLPLKELGCVLLLSSLGNFP